jgi:type VI secretion system protein ImpG
MIEKLYEEELEYLYKSGKEFARLHPQTARLLNIDAVGDRDPYVERLFEGFAFLSARIREKIEDSFPEIAQGLINITHPEFIQEIPSLTIVEFKPRKGHLQEAKKLLKGAELLSNPVGADGVLCRFHTTQDLIINPVFLRTLEKKRDSHNKGEITLKFELDGGVKWQNLNLTLFRIYLHGEYPLSSALYELLTRHVEKVTVTLDNGRYSTEIDNPDPVSSAGFLPATNLFNLMPQSPPGYSFLLEYFAFPEKFLFVNFAGLENIPALNPSPGEFSITLKFDCDFPNYNFGKGNFLLHCSPAVNLFRHDAEPVINTWKKREYLILADFRHPDSIYPHSVVSVTGIDLKNATRYEYKSPLAIHSLTQPAVRKYSTVYRTGAGAKRELYISINGNECLNRELNEESLSIEILGTNGNIPREELDEGEICKPGRGFPDSISFQNIIRPTISIPPPSDQDYHWSFIAHMGALHSSFSTAGSLKSILRLYNWNNSEINSMRIEAVKSVSLKPVDMLYLESIVRGIEYTIDIDENTFPDSGDICLFGEIIKEFLSDHISINSFLKLIVVLKPSEKQIVWNSIRGTKWPI